jgi:uncharacterized protein (UPF0210 family)
MIIRALTGFLDPGWPLEPERVRALATCLKQCRAALADAGYEVQTLRLATPPPLEMTSPVSPAQRADLARALEAEIFLNGMDYAAIGPALPEEPQAYELLPDLLGATETVFTSALFAEPQTGLSLPAARACAATIHSVSTLSPDGFANLRFAALANVLAGTPFFPAAYHRGGTAALAVATEAADLAVNAFDEAESLQVARHRLVGSIESHAHGIAQVVRRCTAKHGVQFFGIDFSMAPFPEPLRSIGTALERTGVPHFGLAGSAAAVSFITDCIDRAEFERTGFCALILPVLEDSVLAARGAEGQLTTTSLLLYASLCGTGLDTVPLPGDISTGELAALLMDMGALALRHNKPLTARLMPIPGKKAGDQIHFDFEYFASSRVLAPRSQTLEGLLGGEGTLDIGPLRT